VPVAAEPGFPEFRQVVLDSTDARGLAEFYRQLLGLRYRPGDEPPADGAPDDSDWLVLVDATGTRRLAFQQVDELPRPTWPDGAVPQQLHLDMRVDTIDALDRQRDRAVELGAEIRRDGRDDPEEAIYVFADPAGHPFCIFVG
jgi:catechol 2,3-dioxygenase-like lactoylglutathione lyase family enzyme